MGWLKKAKSQLSLKNIRRKTTTIKGVTSFTKNITGVGVLERSKTARKAALIGLAAGGAYFAAPYAAGAGKFAAGKIGSIGTKIGAMAGNLLSRKLGPGQVGDMVGPPEPTSPTEDNFYNQYGQGDDSGYAASGRQRYGAAAMAGGGAGMSSCSGQANATEFFVDHGSIVDYIANTVGWIDGVIFVAAIVAIFGLTLDSYLVYRKRAKAKGF